MENPVVHLTKKDFELEFYRGTGNGGQNRNKVSSCCRIYHRPSGCVASCEEERDQIQNKKIAFERLVNLPKFRLWITREHFIKLGKVMSEKQIEAKVDDMMQIENLKIEVKKDGKWEEVSLSDLILE